MPTLLGRAEQAPRAAALAWHLACAAPPLLAIAPGALALTLHVTQKAGFLGAFGPSAVDTAVGGAIGLGVASLGGLLVPWAAYALRRCLPVRGWRGCPTVPCSVQCEDRPAFAWSGSAHAVHRVTRIAAQVEVGGSAVKVPRE